MNEEKEIIKELTLLFKDSPKIVRERDITTIKGSKKEDIPNHLLHKVEYFYVLTYPDNVNPVEEKLILDYAASAGAAGWSILAPAVATAKPLLL